MASKFVPRDWKLTDDLKQFALDKKLTESQVNEEEACFRDHQYKRPMIDFDACWRNWIRNAIKFGIELPVEPRYRTIEPISEQQKARDDADGVAQMDKYRKAK